MSGELLRDLPRTLPAFIERFGSDAQCRAYLVRALWPDGFCCAGCGHREAWSHRKWLIEECRACGKQHSILAGTIFEQTKTGLPRLQGLLALSPSEIGSIASRRSMVSRHLPGDVEQGRHLGDGAAAAAGFRQLSDRLELAAQAPPGPKSHGDQA